MIDYKNLLTKEINVVDCSGTLNYVNNIKNGSNDFVFPDQTLKCFYYAKNTNKICVFLSSIGIQRDRYPIYNRISWINHFDGIILFFDDPTRDKIKFSPSFYLGNKSNTVLQRIKTIIYGLKDRYNIDNSDISFISSSNGGFGVLQLANEFPYSKCISYCPQFDIKIFLGPERFNNLINKIGFSKEELELKNIQERLNALSIIENTQTKFFIYSNISCNSDKRQIDYFCKTINFNFSLGLNRINENMYLLLTEFEYFEPHSVQPNVNFTLFIENFFWDESIEFEKRYQLLQYLLSEMKDYNQLDFNNKMIISYFSILKNSITKFRINKLDNNLYDVYITDFVYAHFKYTSDSINIVPSLRFIKKLFNNADKLHHYAIDHKDDVIIDENNTLINIFSKYPIPIKSFSIWIYKVLSFVDVI